MSFDKQGVRILGLDKQTNMTCTVQEQMSVTHT